MTILISDPFYRIWNATIKEGEYIWFENVPEEQHNIANTAKPVSDLIAKCNRTSRWEFFYSPLYTNCMDNLPFKIFKLKENSPLNPASL
jgi:hypothetical protein